jgi:hypothetical protein
MELEERFKGYVFYIFFIADFNPCVKLSEILDSVFLSNKIKVTNNFDLFLKLVNFQKVLSGGNLCCFINFLNG